MSAARDFPSPALGYPRSFLGLLAAGFLLVSLPLAGALLFSAWHTERLTEQSRSAVFDAARAARASRTLVNRIGSIERLALQLAVAPDVSLRDDYARVHASFRQVTAELALLPLDAEQTAALKRTVEREAALHAMVESVLLPPKVQGKAAQGKPVPIQGPDQRGALRAMAGGLAEDAYEMLAISHLVVDREVERLRRSAEDMHLRLLALVVISTALALAAALALSRFIARPIAELDAAIRQLGAADFERPIRVRGPEDLRGLGERLDWLRLRLTELEANRSRFLRHLSHDLKTPLAALREGAELLNDQVAGPLAPPQRQVVAILRDNSVKLQRQIEELLDYQRVLHAAAGLAPAPVALDALLRQSVLAHRLAAGAKGLQVRLDATPQTIRADGQKLRAVFDNLLGNAVKFTPAGGIVRVVARDGADAAVVDVLDSGPGVPDEEREAIFDAFFRGRAGASGRAEGTGLGLAIAREFTEAHGGRIEVVQGTRGGHFRVTLPKRSSTALAEAA